MGRAGASRRRAECWDIGDGEKRANVSSEAASTDADVVGLARTALGPAAAFVAGRRFASSSRDSDASYAATSWHSWLFSRGG
jgi:hypothetical protein